MDDLIKRLRTERAVPGLAKPLLRNPDGPEAATRIETLEAHVAELEEVGWQDRVSFTRKMLIRQIEWMLNELGNPPLVDRIFRNGWRSETAEKLGQLFDLCVRTNTSPAQPSQETPHEA